MHGGAQDLLEGCEATVTLLVAVVNSAVAKENAQWVVSDQQFGRGTDSKSHGDHLVSLAYTSKA